MVSEALGSRVSAGYRKRVQGVALGLSSGSHK